MKIILLFLLAAAAFGQAPNPPASPDIQPTLQKLEQTAQDASLDLARLRIDKWKTESDVKRQSQSNADSISRNLTSALPGLIQAARNNPRDLTATFKLYRNLNALYDVFVSLTESAGAFGSKQEFEALGRQLQDLDTYRRSFGDYMEGLTAAKEAELVRVRKAAAAAATPPAPPKKIIVDNDLHAKPSKKKKQQ